MIGVYLGILTFATVVVGKISDICARRDQRKVDRERRQWEVEDRNYKDQLARDTAEAARALDRSTHAPAAGVKEEFKAAINISKAERKAEIKEVLAAVDQNTVITQEAKAASKEAIDLANGHNAKIVEATKLAQAALEKASATQQLM